MNIINRSTRITTEKATKILHWVASKVGVDVHTNVDIEDLDFTRHWFFGVARYSGDVELKMAEYPYVGFDQDNHHIGMPHAKPLSDEEYLVALAAHEFQHVKDIQIYGHDLNAYLGRTETERRAYGSAHEQLRLYREEKLAGLSFDSEPELPS